MPNERISTGSPGLKPPHGLVRQGRKAALFGAVLGLPGLVICGATSAVRAEQQQPAPLSAIDWLSQSLVTPAAMPAPVEPPVSKKGATPENVTVQTLGADSTDGLGLLPPEVTKLPKDLWGVAQVSDISGLLQRDNAQDLPAMQSLMLTLLLAEADPPSDIPAGESLFLARVDKLMQMGALDQARALLDTAGAARSPEIFRRYFDVALLIGDEDRACEALKGAPGLAPALPTRIFCLARAGDFDTAELTLDTSKALGTVSPEEAALLTRFMDPSLDEEGITPIMPKPVTPLIFRIYEAIGEPLPETSLPVAFTYADLSDQAGWKAQLEAVERLSRLGSVAPNLLLGLYTQQKPAASGGVWDRVAAFQALDKAVAAKDPKAVARTLPPAWTLMQQAELEVPFATLYGAALAKLTLSGDTANVARSVMLLSPDYAKLTRNRQSSDATGAFALAVAQGTPEKAPATTDMARAILAGFTTPEVPQEIQALLDQGRIGEALLMTMPLMHEGEAGDMRAVTGGISVLHKLGLEDVARRAGLQLLLLDRRG
jgi:hypothetical protein